MTCDEITKALEELMEEQENGYVTALEHGGKRDKTHEGFLDLLGSTIYLINRLQAEIERFNFENLQMIASIKRLKSKAVNEFAERLEPLKKFRSCMATMEYELSVTMRDVDAVKKELMKELVGDNNCNTQRKEDEGK